MNQQYNHADVEEKWLEAWRKAELFQGTSNQKPETRNQIENKMYLLFAFAYPSGAGLHVGHVESKTALDILARYYRMQGKEVFFPVGWDAFGLPAENYAVKTGVHPAETTKTAIEAFEKQVERIGISYDWETEIATSHPEYYKWTQWLFLQLHKRGLAYKAPGKVNWCPSCQTVLANEQVVQKIPETSDQKPETATVTGVCERCETPVIQRDLDQWYFKITQYADELVSGLDQVDWPVATKQQQLHWIGKKRGVKITFEVRSTKYEEIIPNNITTFTTRIDTVFGVTFVVISPELAQAWIDKGWDAPQAVREYVTKAFYKTEEERRIGEKEKTGVDTGLTVVNPVNKEEVPVWVADYVLNEYGTGAVMGVPAHDERDAAFARKYQFPIRKVIDIHQETHSLVIKKSVTDGFVENVKKHNWYLMDYLGWGWGVVIPKGQEDEYIRIVQQHLVEGSWYVHTDGLISKVIFKQHFFDSADNAAKEYARMIGIPEEQIDWDDVNHFQFTWSFYGELFNSGKYSGISSEDAMERIPEDYPEVMENTTTYKLRDWLISRQRYWGAPIPIVYDPQGKAHPVKEEHLPWRLPTDVEFKPTGESPLTHSKEFKERVERLYGPGWRPEYDTMDTFVDSSWYYLRYTDARNTEAFADKERLQKWMPVDFYMIGPEHIVLHLLYSRFFTKFLRDQGHLSFDEPFVKMRHQGMILGPDHKKMSKSKGNVITPDEIIETYGADTLRMYEMFMGPIDADKPWDPRAVAGVHRLLKRVWKLA
jgi:leucyl-tRNA synthetase